MSIDFDTITAALVSIAQERVGGNLSTMTGEFGSEPSVIVSKDQGPTPKTPYIQLDLMGTRKQGSHQIGEGMLENQTPANAAPIFETMYTIRYTFLVIGGDATGIAHELERNFNLEYVADKLALASGATLSETFDVISVPRDQSTHVVDAAAFEFTMAYNDRYVDQSESGLYDTVQIAGTVQLDDDDPNPQTLTVDQTSGYL